MPVNDRVAGPAADAARPAPEETVPEETAPEQTAPAETAPSEPSPAGRLARPAGRLARLAGLASLASLARAHRPFLIALAAAALLRVVVMVGYPPAMFFNDSYNYMTDAVTGIPDVVRANGYPFFLRLLLPFHSLALVTSLQALMGLAMGAGIYAVLRRRGLPWWGAAIPALPVLFDVFEVQLEHMVAADVLFYTLITAVLVLLCWWDRPPLAVAVIVGLATGYAATVRSVGEPLLILVVAGMLLRRMGALRAALTAVAGVLPIFGYMLWFHASTGQYALNEATGTFLYSRVQAFADCGRINPPADLRVLCDPKAIKDRPVSQEYLWSNQTPLEKLTGRNNIYRFTPHIESLTTRFAIRAIEAQPLSYAKVVVKDTLRTFDWRREGVNDPKVGNVEGSGSKFRFEPAADILPVPSWVTGNPANASAAMDFGGANYGHTSVVRPWSTLLRGYQKVFYLRGPLLFLLVLAGAVGVVLGLRRRTRLPGTGWGGLGLLPWAVGVAMIVIPPITAGFSYRYSLAAVPAICLAAGLAFVGRGNLITWFRKKRAKASPASAEG
jgi:hypothetical protein